MTEIIDYETMRAATADWRSRFAPAQSEETFTSKVEAKVVKNYLAEAKLGEVTLRCDEPKGLGGEGEGPSPMQFFLAGAGFNLLVHLVRTAVDLDVRLDSLGVTVTALRSRKGSQYALGVPPESSSAPLAVTFDVSCSGNVSAEDLARLIAVGRQRAGCVTSLELPMRVDVSVALNGKPVPLASTVR